MSMRGNRVRWADVPERFRVVAVAASRIGILEMADWCDDLDAGYNPGALDTCIRACLARKQIISDHRVRDVLRNLYRWEVRQCQRSPGYPVPALGPSGLPPPWGSDPDDEPLDDYEPEE